MPSFNFCINSPRLIITPLNATIDSHCDFMVELTNSPEIHASHGRLTGGIPDRETARKWITDGQVQFASQGWGRYLVLLKGNPSMPKEEKQQMTDRLFSFITEECEKIGTVSLRIRENGPSVPDIGYSVVPRHWGKGYATEAADALLRYFNEDKGWTEFTGYCHPENQGSRGVLRKLGFEERGMREVRGLMPGGEAKVVLVWSRGLKKTLDEYGIRAGNEF